MAAVIPMVMAGAAAAGTSGAALTALSLMTTVAGGVMSYSQAQAQSDQADLQARAAAVNGRMEAIATNDELLKTLSMNNAAAAASGLQSSGSVARANEAAQRKAAQELDVNRFNTSMEVSALNQKAESATNAGVTTLAGSLFDAVDTGYSAYKKIKGTK